MKLTKLSEQILKFISKSDMEVFGFSDFTEFFSDVDANSIKSSIDILVDNGYVSAFYADNIPFSTSILPKGIEYVEKNNLLNKVYNVVKEINSLR